MIRRSGRRFGKLLTPEIGIASGLLAVGIEVAISVGVVRASGWLSALSVIACAITMIVCWRTFAD